MIVFLMSLSVITLLIAASLSPVARGEESWIWTFYALPFAVFVALPVVNPSYARTLSEGPLGQTIITYAAVVTVVGALLMRGITNVNH